MLLNSFQFLIVFVLVCGFSAELALAEEEGAIARRRSSRNPIGAIGVLLVDRVLRNKGAG